MVDRRGSRLGAGAVVLVAQGLVDAALLELVGRARRAVVAERRRPPAGAGPGQEGRGRQHRHVGRGARVRAHAGRRHAGQGSLALLASWAARLRQAGLRQKLAAGVCAALLTAAGRSCAQGGGEAAVRPSPWRAVLGSGARREACCTQGPGKEGKRTAGRRPAPLTCRSLRCGPCRGSTGQSQRAGARRSRCRPAFCGAQGGRSQGQGRARPAGKAGRRRAGARMQQGGVPPATRAHT